MRLSLPLWLLNTPRGLKRNFVIKATPISSSSRRVSHAVPASSTDPTRIPSTFNQPAHGDWIGHLANGRIPRLADVPGGLWLYAETMWSRPMPHLEDVATGNSGPPDLDHRSTGQSPAKPPARQTVRVAHAMGEG